MKEINIYRLDVGSCNGCDIEVFSAVASRFGMKELGAKIVDDPSEANVLLVTGVPTVKMQKVLEQVRGKLKDPGLVIAVGACALAGEAFEDSYSIDGMVDEVVDVNVYVPGCPPSPQAIIGALSEALGVEPKATEVPQGFRGFPQVDAEKCTACGACVQVCPTSAIELAEQESNRIVKFIYEKCVSCASCEEACPEDAIELPPERPPATSDRKAIGTSAEVRLAKCEGCGALFAPERQLDSVLKRIVDEVKEYEKLRDSLRRAMKLCPKCRGSVPRAEEAKTLLSQLTDEITALER